MDDYSTTLKKYKNKNIENVYNVSLALFAKKGIPKVSLNEIATKSEIGVASLYRYFNNKKTLICECAVYHLEQIVKDIKPSLNSIQSINKKGIDELEKLLSFYTFFYKEKKTFLKFLSEFDSYISFNKMDKDLETSYNRLYKSFYTVARKIYKKGLTDGSIREDFLFENFYYTTSASLFQTCIKGAVSPSIIPLDDIVSIEEKLKTQIEIAIYYCKKEML